MGGKGPRLQGLASRPFPRVKALSPPARVRTLWERQVLVNKAFPEPCSEPTESDSPGGGPRNLHV